jgi:hypothetical protein
MEYYDSIILVSGDYEVQYRYRGLCPGRQDLVLKPAILLSGAPISV